MAKTSEKKQRPQVYEPIISAIFKKHNRTGLVEFEFERDEIVQAAGELKLTPPKNLGDLVYYFRYRKSLPDDVIATARSGFEWIIEGRGTGRYAMKQVTKHRIRPRTDMMAVKIPDSTPEIISAYALGDEQALLAKVRYNRLIDVFLGVTAYSLQNHLRTTVKGLGQIEIDEIYVALDRSGVQYVVPVQAKGGNDEHSVVQSRQDFLCCKSKFPGLVCRAVSTQFMENKKIAMFELLVEGDEVQVVQERHFRLVPAEQISPEDLKTYYERRT